MYVRTFITPGCCCNYSWAQDCGVWWKGKKKTPTRSNNVSVLYLFSFPPWGLVFVWQPVRNMNLCCGSPEWGKRVFLHPNMFHFLLLTSGISLMSSPPSAGTLCLPTHTAYFPLSTSLCMICGSYDACRYVRCTRARSINRLTHTIGQYRPITHMFFQEIMAQSKILRVFPESLNYAWRGNNVSVDNVVDC